MTEENQLKHYRFVSPYDENYHEHWPINVRGKKVLDIGADWGSTADYFLLLGATEIIAVEADDESYTKLVENSKKISGIIPIHQHVDCDTDEIAALIKKYEPNVVKLDGEGCEHTLPQIPPEILRIADTYAIEMHHETDHFPIIWKLLSCGFTVKTNPNFNVVIIAERINYLVHPKQTNSCFFGTCTLTEK